METLVLNQNYQAISLCSPERALVLVLLRKAEMVSEVESRKLRSVSATFGFPSIIRLSFAIGSGLKRLTWLSLVVKCDIDFSLEVRFVSGRQSLNAIYF